MEKSFPKVLVLYQMQSASSRIWTRVAMSIPYADNHDTTDTSRVFKIQNFMHSTQLPEESLYLPPFRYLSLSLYIYIYICSR